MNYSNRIKALLEELSNLIKESDTDISPKEVSLIFQMMSYLTEDLHNLSLKNKYPSDLQNNIVSNSFKLARNALIFLSNTHDADLLSNFQKSPEEGYKLVEDIFISALNIIDFESPSWHPIARTHLYYGLEVVSARNWILRDIKSLTNDKPEDMNVFPQIAR